MFKFIDNFYDWWKNIDKIILFLIIILFSLGLFFCNFNSLLSSRINERFFRLGRLLKYWFLISLLKL